MRTRIFAAFILSVLFCSSLNGQIITIIDAESGAPIPGAVISSPSAMLTASENGTFDLSVFSPLDSITIRHIAYVQTTVLVESLNGLETISLQPKNFLQNEITISGEKPEVNSSQREEKLISPNDAAVYQTSGGILRSKFSLSVRDYGGGSLQSVSMRGLGSENTLVLFNEMRVNDLFTGGFDFSAVNTYSLTKIAFIKSAAQNEYLSPGGVISLHTGSSEDTPPLRAAFRFGAYNDQSYSISAAHRIDEVRFSVNVERSYSPNHYAYRFDGSDYERQNADYSKFFINTFLTWERDGNTLSWYGNATSFTNGIPGFVVTNNTASSRASLETTGVINILEDMYHLSPDLSLHLGGGQHYQELIIFDPDKMLLAVTDRSRSDVSDYFASAKLDYNNNMFAVRGGYEFTYSELKKDRTFIEPLAGRKHFFRNVHRLFILPSVTLTEPLPFLKKAVLNASTSVEFLSEKHDYSVNESNAGFALGFSVVPAFFEYLAITGNYNNTYRLPTMNERHYSDLYASSPLQKETYQGFDVSIDFSPVRQTSVSFTYFAIDAHNKIQWIPGRQAIQIPKNFAHVVTSGIEILLRQSFFNEAVSLQSSYTFTEALNRPAFSENDNTYNKQLVYTPKHRLNASLDIRYAQFTGFIGCSFTGEQYYTSDNTLQNRLDASAVFDAGGGYSTSFAGINASVHLTVYNIFNAEYFYIQSYPMPQQHWIISFSFEVL